MKTQIRYFLIVLAAVISSTQAEFASSCEDSEISECDASSEDETSILKLPNEILAKIFWECEPNNFAQVCRLFQGIATVPFNIKNHHTLYWKDGDTVRQAFYQEIARDPQLARSYFANAEKIDPRIAEEMDHQTIGSLLASADSLRNVNVVVEYLHKHFDTFEAALLKKKEEQLLEMWSTGSQLETLSRFVAYSVIDLSAPLQTLGACMCAGRDTAWAAASDSARAAGDIAARDAAKSARNAAWDDTREVRNTRKVALAYCDRKTAYAYINKGRTYQEVREISFSVAALTVLNWTLSVRATDLRELAEKAASKKLESLTADKMSIALTAIENNLWNNPNRKRNWGDTLFKDHPHVQIMKKLFSSQAVVL